MLGALEVKTISRLAAKCGSAWKPLHTAVLGCLLAHRNRHTGHCWPKRRLIAAHCNVSERTVDRAIEQLVAWGALERQQPRGVSSQQFREAQYVFRFELPQVAENSCGLEEKSCANRSGRATEFGRAVRQNSVGPCDKIGGPIRKEEKDLEGKVRKGEAPPPPPRSRTDYTQTDFDERDWRKLNRQISLLRESNAAPDDGGERFKLACQRAGISARRGYELWERMMA